MENKEIEFDYSCKCANITFDPNNEDNINDGYTSLEDMIEKAYYGVYCWTILRNIHLTK